MTQHVPPSENGDDEKLPRRLRRAKKRMVEPPRPDPRERRGPAPNRDAPVKPTGDYRHRGNR